MKKQIKEVLPESLPNHEYWKLVDEIAELIKKEEGFPQITAQYIIERFIKNDPWISVNDFVPELLEGKDYSANVLAIKDGALAVMAYCWINNDAESGCAWADCYGDIHGDAEFDDDYKPTHWMNLPKPPQP